MSKKRSLIIALSQDVIFKPFFLLNLIRKLKTEDIKIAKIIEVSTKNNTQVKRNKNTFKVWGLVSYLQFISIFLIKKLLSATPLPLKFKWKNTVKLIARKYKINYEFIDNFNKYLLDKNYTSDYIVFCFQHEIIKNPGKYKCSLINCHPGDLAEYRGIMPIFWAMSDEKKSALISLHFIDSGIDTGELILEKSFNLKKSLGDNYFIAYKLSAEVVCDSIKKLIRNKNSAKFSRKSKLLNSYKSFPNEVNIRKFKKLNYTTSLSFKNFLKLLKTF